MNDLLGTKMSANNARKLNEPSDQATGEKLPEHAPSREEREYISESSGREDGDYRHQE